MIARGIAGAVDMEAVSASSPNDDDDAALLTTVMARAGRRC